jgi:hypothetical protein
MQSTYSVADIKAACKRWVAEGRSWDGLVEATLCMVAASTYDCQSRQTSLAELDIRTGAFLERHRQMLLELGNGSYYGYRIGPNLFRKAEARILAASEEAQRIGRERLDNPSPQARAGEAQLAARHLEGTDKDVELSGLPRLRDYPIADGFAKDDSGERVADYMTADLHLKHPGARNLDPEIVLGDPCTVDMRHGFLDVVEALASDKNNLFEHPSPPAHIRDGLNWEAKRKRTAHRKKWMPPTEEEELGFGTLKNPRNIEETQLNARIDWKRGLAELGLSSDQIQALKARAEGLGLQGSETAESLGLTRDQLECARRLLCPDQKPGKALRRHFSAYNSTADAK